MRNKEALLSFNNPVRFIFSHSALREGWDNPNVFQICKLRSSGSEISKLQEVGRGLRLPVDEYGNRIIVSEKTLFEKVKVEFRGKANTLIISEENKILKNINFEFSAHIADQFLHFFLRHHIKHRDIRLFILLTDRNPVINPHKLRSRSIHSIIFK